MLTKVVFRDLGFSRTWRSCLDVLGCDAVWWCAKIL